MFVRTFRLAVLIAFVLLIGVGGCSMMRFRAVTEIPQGPAAHPAVLGPLGGDPAIHTVAEWEQRRRGLLETVFQREVYGFLPDAGPVVVVSRKRLPAADHEPALPYQIEEIVLRVENQDHAPEFTLVLALPKGADGPLPVIVGSTFCGHRTAFQREDVSGPKDWWPEGPCTSALFRFLGARIFGDHIATPPLEMIAARGYVYASLYPGDVVPDHAEFAEPALGLLSPGTNGDDRLGAIGAWAWVYLRALDYLETDERIERSQMSIYGHSRLGKSVLLAAALDQRVALTLSHQSGTGGATLNRSHVGESVNSITSSYPFWFNNRYTNYAGREDAIPVDQHMLIAMIAPRPVLLGNARRDRWSDPQGSFRAALGADAVYELYGATGLDQATLTAFNRHADLGFFMRGGGHGVTGDDWSNFLDYLDAQFKGTRGSDSVR